MESWFFSVLAVLLLAQLGIMTGLLRRLAVASEAIAEAQGSLVDVTLAQAELAAHRTNPSPAPTEEEQRAAQLNWNVRCVGCGCLIALCRCSLGSVLRRKGNGSDPSDG